tara:strand:+ start:176 stop:427 length:252 start_codon:yes stop_codon:yes gene_type:complete
MSEVTRMKEEIKSMERMIDKIKFNYENGDIVCSEDTKDKLIKVCEDHKKSLEFAYKMIDPIYYRQLRLGGEGLKAKNNFDKLH